MTKDWLREWSQILSAPLRLVAASLDATLRILGEDEPLERSDPAPGPKNATQCPDGDASLDIPVTRRAVTLEKVPERREAAPAGLGAERPKGVDGTTTILPRSPETAFVFWTPGTAWMAAVHERSGGPVAHLGLRLRSRGPESADISERIEPLRPGAEHCYLTGLPAGAHVEVTLGLCDDEFHPVNAPVSLRMPHRSLSRRNTTPRWRDQKTGRDVTGSVSLMDPRSISPRDLGRNLPPQRETTARVTVDSPAPNPRGVPARE